MTGSSRDHILLYINGTRHEVRGVHAFMNLSEYLRLEAGLTGTKVVCAEGDCGACTILYARPTDFVSTSLTFKTLNSCIQPIFNLDGSVIVSVEGLQNSDQLSSIQSAMINAQGAQCGYCTPGICNSLTLLAETAKQTGTAIVEKKARNFLTGNLCRCTGYEPILTAACKIDLRQYQLLSERYYTKQVAADLLKQSNSEVYIEASIGGEDGSIWIPTSLDSLSKVLGRGRLVSGATDLGVQRNKHKLHQYQFISLCRLSELALCEDHSSEYWIGAKANWDKVEALVLPTFPELSRLIHVFASPQIKHISTLVGNLVNASPIADVTPFMLVNDATLVILMASGLTREVTLNGFYKGYKDIDLKNNEVVTAIRLPKNSSGQRAYKVSQRKDLDIAIVNCAIRYEINNDKFTLFKIAFGGVAATTIRMPALEQWLLGRSLKELSTAQNLDKCDLLIDQTIHPLSDVRGSSDYRLMLCKNFLRKFVAELGAEQVAEVGI